MAKDQLFKGPSPWFWSWPETYERSSRGEGSGGWEGQFRGTFFKLGIMLIFKGNIV